jgi:hypothetical protein
VSAEISVHGCEITVHVRRNTQLNEAERETITKPITAGFYEANWLDIAILAIVVFLFAWTVRRLLSIFRSSPGEADASKLSESQVSP